MNDIEWKPLRIADAPALKRLGVYQGSKKKIEASIRHLLSLRDWECLIMDADDGEGQQQTGFIALVPDPFHAETGRLTLHTSDPKLLPAALETAIRSGFRKHPFLRIETWIPADRPDLAPLFESNGFHDDCLIQGSAFRKPGFADRRQMSILKTESQYPAVGLVPYKLGVLSVIGTETHIQRLDFHYFGEPVSQPDLNDVFHIDRLLDDQDRLKHDLERIKQVRQAQLPAMVRQAVSELDEYIAGTRAHFDVQLDLQCGSDFQRRVWELLSEIPYGTTVTYLDIALQMTENDLKKARSLTRAVGSACGANPVPILIPCHRVIGHDGRLTGYSGGIQNKEFLLDHEMFGLR